MHYIHSEFVTLKYPDMGITLKEDQAKCVEAYLEGKDVLFLAHTVYGNLNWFNEWGSALLN